MWCLTQVFLYALSCFIDLCLWCLLSCTCQSWETTNWLCTSLLHLCWLRASLPGLCLESHLKALWQPSKKFYPATPGNLLRCLLLTTRGSQGVSLEFLSSSSFFPFLLDLSPFLCCIPPSFLFPPAFSFFPFHLSSFFLTPFCVKPETVKPYLSLWLHIPAIWAALCLQSLRSA